MSSDKQKEANVHNTRFSTGPVTQDGKAVVARNEIRHDEKISETYIYQHV